MAKSSDIPGGLSAFIIARDESADLPGALASLSGLADEIVVLVGEDSSDKTADIARASGAKVGVRKFDDYASHKSAALGMATREWALSIDADERLSPGLRREIPVALSRAGTEVAGFVIPFVVHFMGRPLRFGGLGHERHLRLFRRTRGRFVGGALHEGIEVDGPVAALAEPIDHHPYADLAEYLSKLDRYTTLAAGKRFERGERWRPWHHLIMPFEFFVRAVLKLGVLDGHPGLVWAGLSAFHSWLKYVKLGEMEKEKRT